MPPKRKRAEDAPEASTSTTRSTRSSARTSKSNDAPAHKKSQPVKKSVKKVTTEISSDEGSPPAPKKAKKAAPKTTAKKATAKSKVQPSNVINSDNNGAPEKKDKLPSKKLEPYSAQKVQSLFTTYANKENAEAIGAEGFGELCSDAEIPMDGALPLILFWHLGAKELGSITKEEWTKGMESSKISSLQALWTFLNDVHALLFTKSPPMTAKKAPATEPYDMAQYSKYASDREGSFSKFYMSCFLLVKPGQSRNIEMETAVTFWSVLLTPLYPIMNEVIAFINERGTYKAANKDVWSMMLEFCKTVDLNLDNYEADGAWPTLLDDFVSWKKDQSVGNDKDAGENKDNDE